MSTTGDPRTNKSGTAGVPDVDDLAQYIRKIDGNHTMGAAALAQHIVEWLCAGLAAKLASELPPTATPEVLRAVRWAPCEVELLPAGAPFFRTPGDQRENFGGPPWKVWRYKQLPGTAEPDLVADFDSKEEADEAVADLNAKGDSLEDARVIWGPAGQYVRRDMKARAAENERKP